MNIWTYPLQPLLKVLVDEERDEFRGLLIEINKGLESLTIGLCKKALRVVLPSLAAHLILTTLEVTITLKRLYPDRIELVLQFQNIFDPLEG